MCSQIPFYAKKRSTCRSSFSVSHAMKLERSSGKDPWLKRNGMYCKKASTEADESEDDDFDENELGIKNQSTNYIWLPSSTSRYYDNNGQILIVPILSLNQVQQWNGEGYKAIVVAGKNEGEQGLDARYAYDCMMAGRGGTEDDFFATVTDITTATELLQTIVCNLAASNDCNQILLDSLKSLDRNERKLFNSLTNWKLESILSGQNCYSTIAYWKVHAGSGSCSESCVSRFTR